MDVFQEKYKKMYTYIYRIYLYVAKNPQENSYQLHDFMITYT